MPRIASASSGVAPFGNFRSAAVHRIADQRMTDMRHVHADLMRASGFQTAFDQRVRAESLAHAIVRDGRLARGFVDDGLA